MPPSVGHDLATVLCIAGDPFLASLARKTIPRNPEFMYATIVFVSIPPTETTTVNPSHHGSARAIGYRYVDIKKKTILTAFTRCGLIHRAEFLGLHRSIGPPCAVMNARPRRCCKRWHEPQVIHRRLTKTNAQVCGATVQWKSFDLPLSCFGQHVAASFRL